MSLINDALKRAKQAQNESPEAPAPVPHLKPVETPQEVARHTLGVLVPIGLAVVALLGLMLFWVLWKKESSLVAAPDHAPLAVSARTPSAAISTPTPTAAKEPTAPAPAEVHSSVPEPSPATNAGVATTNQPGGAPESADTNHIASTESAPPAPPPLRLQSIVYNPKSPSAMINGRVVFVGDRVRDLRVVAIHRDDVLLIGAGRTNLLSLEP